MIKMAQFHVSESGSLLMITLVHFEVDVRTCPANPNKHYHYATPNNEYWAYFITIEISSVIYMTIDSNNIVVFKTLRTYFAY